MKKLLAAVAVSALALTSAVPMAQAAPNTAGVHQAKQNGIHKVATAKKKPVKKPAKTTKSSGAKKKTPTKSS